MTVEALAWGNLHCRGATIFQTGVFHVGGDVTFVPGNGKASDIFFDEPILVVE